MLELLFLQILNMSFNGSVVILLVLLIRLGLKKAPKIFSYGLWAVVLCRLILPFSFESIFSLFPARINPIVPEIIYSRVPTIDTGITSVNTLVNGSLPSISPTTLASVNPLQIGVFIGTILWLAGVAILLLYSLVTYLKLKRRLKSAVHQGDNIYALESLSTPFVMGIIQPRIYLPLSLSEKEKPFILLHEQTHIRRFDPLIKIIAFLVLCLHWFNPLVWIGFFCYSKDMEMACDEAVIKKLGNQVKKDYSTSLLSLATGRSMIKVASLAFGEGPTKTRIKNILRYQSPRLWTAGLVTLAVVVIGLGLIANPISKQIPMGQVPAKVTSPTDLWEARTPYVGDNSAVGNLLNLMVVPENLKHRSFKLYTGGDQRGLEWLLDNTNNTDNTSNTNNTDDADFDQALLEHTALLLFATIDNLEDFYVTIYTTTGKTSKLHYDIPWANEILDAPVKSYGESAEKMAMLVDLIHSKIPISTYSIEKIGQKGVVLEKVDLKSPGIARKIWLDAMVKSMVFQGNDMAEFKEYYRLRQVFPYSNEVNEYYAYVLQDGTAVLQSGIDGHYSVIANELYDEMVRLFKE